MEENPADLKRAREAQASQSENLSGMIYPGSQEGSDVSWQDDFFQTPPAEAKPKAYGSKPKSTAHRLKAGPLMMVETAFLASTASLIWLVNYYFPPGPILRIFFPVPTALIYLRWGPRAAWMSALVTGLLLAILMGPPRSVLFIMPYGFLGVQLGFMWRRGANWYSAIALGSLLGTLGFFFKVWLLSLMLGEDLWVYLTTQITEFLTWLLNRLIAFGLLELGSVGPPNLITIQVLSVGLVVVSDVVYLFTVHLAAWFLFERLGTVMSAPPNWVQVLLDD
ncbi:MAG: DUF2232 domain-containing protein [Cyanobacteria bacterium P01_A01_bin.123]